MARARTEEPVVLGVITRPHGVRGEVRVHRFNPSSTLLLEVDRVIVRTAAEARDLAVRGRKRSGDADVLALEGVTRVEDAEALRGAEIAVARRLLPPTSADEHYHADLVGLRVLEAGREIGEVVSIAAYPSVDALRVRTDRGAIEIPILAPYVVAVDLESGTVEVAHTEDFDYEG